MTGWMLMGKHEKPLLLDQPFAVLPGGRAPGVRGINRELLEFRRGLCFGQRAKFLSTHALELRAGGFPGCHPSPQLLGSVLILLRHEGK